MILSNLQPFYDDQQYAREFFIPLIYINNKNYANRNVECLREWKYKRVVMDTEWKPAEPMESGTASYTENVHFLHSQYFIPGFTY